MAIVKEYYSGNTKISFADDSYINNTPEENEKIVDRFLSIARDIFIDSYKKEHQGCELEIAER